MKQECVAWQGETDTQHMVCKWCPDAEEVERVVKSLEWKREIDHLLDGYTDYVRKTISHVICPPCTTLYFPEYLP